MLDVEVGSDGSEDRVQLSANQNRATRVIGNLIYMVVSVIRTDSCHGSGERRIVYSCRKRLSCE